MSIPTQGFGEGTTIVTWGYGESSVITIIIESINILLKKIRFIIISELIIKSPIEINVKIR